MTREGKLCAAETSSSSSSVAAVLARSLSRSVLSSAQHASVGPADRPAVSNERHWPPLSQTLPRSYKVNSSGGPQLSAAWRDAVAKATTVLSRSSSRSSLKQQDSRREPPQPAPARSSNSLWLEQQQQDFGHTLPKCYTQLRSAMAENSLLSPRMRLDEQQSKQAPDKRNVLPVQTVLTVQV